LSEQAVALLHELGYSKVRDYRGYVIVRVLPQLHHDRHLLRLAKIIGRAYIIE
jgi:hypothetical protein